MNTHSLQTYATEHGISLADAWEDFGDAYGWESEDNPFTKTVQPMPRDAAAELCSRHALSDAALVRDRRLQMSEDELAEHAYACEELS